MTRCAVVAALLAAACAAQDDWRGFAREDHVVDGTRVTVVAPRDPVPTRPWIWRARFFGHEPQADVALLERGFHLVYVDVAGLFGNATALARWDAAYRFATGEQQLAPKPALEAMSRGGLIAFRWAAANPDKVACVYADAPVCDINSWPGGKGEGRGSPAAWRSCLEAHGLDEATAADWDGNPIAQLAPLAASKIPILSVCGDADPVVPFAENTAILAARYRALGGWIRVIAKAGVGHHPHSLPDPASIAQFVLRHTVGSGDWFVIRSGLERSRARFVGSNRGRVAFLGGSITHNPGWRDQVAAELGRRFPQTEFDFINAGIPSFGSTPGAFRVGRDVFARGAVDLLFVEAAVNDSTNGRSAAEMTRGMEGIVRHAQRENPAIDIVMLHFVDPAKMREIDTGRIPLVVERHDAVAAHYGVASIDLAAEVTERIAAGEFTWKDDFENLHPSPFGQRLYAATITRLFDRAWPAGATAPVAARELPVALDPLSYDRGRYVSVESARELDGFELRESWAPTDGAGTRRGFVDVPMLVATKVGASLAFEFEGRGIGLLVVAGPDAGRLEWSVDDAPFKAVDLLTKWSGRLHLPWSHVLDAELPAGGHTLRLRVAGGDDAGARGTAVRVAWFLVNG